MSDLIYESNDQVGWITIHRQDQGNTITPDGIQMFHDYLDQAETDTRIRVVCLTNQGDRIFCSGADLGGVMRKGPEQRAEAFRQYADLLLKLYRFPKPTVAKVNGHCMAGGMGFLLACDLVIARDDVRFGTPEVHAGLFPMMIGALIFRNVLRKKAMEMILLGEKFGAAQALDMGLITRACPADQLDRQTDRILNALVAKSPIGIKIGKQAFHAVEGMDLEPALQLLAQRLQDVAATEDAAEGIRAFFEKRSPVFVGK